ncbi:hypothetical protein BGLT_01243 [Caballeronia glathei]|nr:hypothetical protein BGLT_01243 [Caballeronia glathei]
MIQPPSAGPAIGPTVAVIAQSESAIDAFSFGYEPSRIACDSGISGPATAPCSTRATSSTGSVGASPHIHDEITNSRIAPTKRRIWPMRWVSQPVSGMETALDAAKTVMTQVPSLTETPRLPEIVGIATFAIDESSTFMKVASATANVARTSCAPSSGGGGAAAGCGVLMRKSG